MFSCALISQLQSDNEELLGVSETGVLKPLLLKCLVFMDQRHDSSDDYKLPGTANTLIFL